MTYEASYTATASTKEVIEEREVGVKRCCELEL